MNRVKRGILLVADKVARTVTGNRYGIDWDSFDTSKKERRARKGFLKTNASAFYVAGGLIMVMFLLGAVAAYWHDSLPYHTNTEYPYGIVYESPKLEADLRNFANMAPVGGVAFAFAIIMVAYLSYSEKESKLKEKYTSKYMSLYEGDQAHKLHTLFSDSPEGFYPFIDKRGNMGTAKEIPEGFEERYLTIKYANGGEIGFPVYVPEDFDEGSL